MVVHLPENEGVPESVEESRIENFAKLGCLRQVFYATETVALPV